MFGIVLWVIIILFIVICSCPGFLTFFFCVALPIGILVYYISAKILEKFNR